LNKMNNVPKSQKNSPTLGWPAGGRLARENSSLAGAVLANGSSIKQNSLLGGQKKGGALGDWGSQYAALIFAFASAGLAGPLEDPRFLVEGYSTIFSASSVK
jgi:hypothetical protein